MNEVTDGGNQLRLRIRTDWRGSRQFVDGLQFGAQLALVEGNDNLPELQQTLRGGQLMVVSLLAERRSSRHDEKRLAIMQRGQNRPHPGVRNHDRSRLKPVSEL